MYISGPREDPQASPEPSVEPLEARLAVQAVFPTRPFQPLVTSRASRYLREVNLTKSYI
jgi:hypothetical protein